MRKSISFFDVDGTLLKGVSGYHATLELIRRKIIKKRRLPLAILYKALSVFYVGNVRRMYEIAIRDMAGSHLDDILEIGREVFERYVRSQIYREAIDLIEAHRSQGHRLVLMSSGPYMMIKIIEEFFKVDASFSIGPVIENRILQNRVHEPLSFWHGKTELARREADAHGLSLRECYYYADGYHDFPLLAEVGYPHVVNPDRKLKREALRHGWPVLEFKHLLG